MKVWNKAGYVGIDSGTLMVGDPCYHLHKEKGQEHKEFGKSWPDFAGKLDGVDAVGAKQIGDALAVVTKTGMGDGTYRVYVRKGKDRQRPDLTRVEAVKIVFIPRSERTLPAEKKAEKGAKKRS